MKARELNVESEILGEKACAVKSKLKEKKREIQKTELILNKLKRQYKELLEKDIDEIYYDEIW